MISRAPQDPVRRGARVAGRALATLTTPLLPDDYLGLINPLWSARELRGRVVATRPVGPASTELTIRPGAGAVDHVPGQHIGVGVELGGRWHWRTYSPTSLPGELLTITVTAVADGSVSPYLAHVARPGDVLRLGPPAGGFTLAAGAAPVLFVTGGSGITPVLGMLRALGPERDAVVVHSGRDALVHGDDLRELVRPGLRSHERHTGRDGRLTPSDLRSLVPDWRERTAYVCGPEGMIDAVVGHHEAAGVAVHHERFAPPTTIDAAAARAGTGGTVTFSGRGVRASAVADPATPLLVAGEDAGALLPHGCRMGICRTCVGSLVAGAVQDLQTGELHDAGPDQTVRTCVSAAVGDVHITYP